MATFPCNSKELQGWHLVFYVNTRLVPIHLILHIKTSKHTVHTHCEERGLVSSSCVCDIEAGKWGAPMNVPTCVGTGSVCQSLAVPLTCWGWGDVTFVLWLLRG